MSHPVSNKQLLVLVGATAVGKTDTSIDLAAKYQCPILSADSRQCYRELGVATAKPSDKVLKQVKHYFINSHSIHQPVSAAEYEDYALTHLEEVFKNGDYCLMTGGSGLYIQAVCDGLDEIPIVPESLRLELETKWQQEGLPWLQKTIRKLDPDLCETIDLDNPRRLIRALEVCIHTNRPFSSFRMGTKQARSFNIIKLGLRRDREILYQRINQRMDQMIEQGLFEEAQQLYEFRHLKPLQTVGYQEIFDFFDQKYPREEAIRLLKRNSRRYAKRQLTWFKKDTNIHWFDAEDQSALFQYLDKVAPLTRN